LHRRQKDRIVYEKVQQAQEVVRGHTKLNADAPMCAWIKRRLFQFSGDEPHQSALDEAG
jgi:hypothetical protein